MDWRIELLNHLRPHFCCALILIAFLLLLTKRTKWIILLILPLALNSFILKKTLLFKPYNTSYDVTLSVLHYALDSDNTNIKGGIKGVNIRKADIVIIQEVTPLNFKTIQQSLSNYSLVISEPRENTHGSAIFIKKNSLAKIVEFNVNFLPESSERPLLDIKIEKNGNEIRILSLHVIRPRNAVTSEDQIVEFRSVAEWAKECHLNREKVLIIGDFNTTPWSKRFIDFTSEAALKDSIVGFGLQGTWPSLLPALFRIPIDNAVCSNSLKVAHRSVDKLGGSDHLCLQVDLAF